MTASIILEKSAGRGNIAQDIDFTAIHRKTILLDLYSPHPCGSKKCPHNNRMGEAGAIIDQSTVKPISCTIFPRPTDLSRGCGLIIM